MRHAYLIIAHHEYEILKLLIDCLDDSRNDIYVHFDKKAVSPLPELKVSKANIYILEDRLDVRWGHFSQIEVELLLFEYAYKRNTHYSYYHLISGVDLPIKSQDYIHDFFIKYHGKEFIGFTQGDTSKEIDRKVRRYHLFSGDFRNGSGLQQQCKKIIRSAMLRIQEILGIKRNKKIVFKKGTNWVSITHEFVGFVLTQKQTIKKMYGMTFCADEIFIQTICWNSPYKENVYDLFDSRNSSKRMIKWYNNVIHDWIIDDVDYLILSSGLFARKFTCENLSLVHHIVNRVLPR